ncbi:MAG: flavin-containing monooxygenase [Candidatus Dormibacteria bacterium]
MEGTLMASALPSATEIVVIGTGFSGLAMAARLVREGWRELVVLERGAEVGGTWRDNTYPGCACDVPSHLYSFSFAPNPNWSSTYSAGPEIKAYLQRVARDHGVLPFVRFNCHFKEGTWDATSQAWRIETSDGPILARYLIVASGALSEPSIPDLQGFNRFRGVSFHSATWDHDFDLTGKRVAVIGTGASAIQFVPAIQPRVARLDLFQRTPPWIIPRSARPVTRFERAVYRAFPVTQRLTRAAIFAARESIAVLFLHARLAPLIRLLAEAHLRRQIRDPALRRKLTPTYDPGCKRILISNDYLPALKQSNVEVITDGIAEVREHSIVTRDGVEREVDAIIFGTGFHVTDWPLAEHLRGRDGRTMAEAAGGSLQAFRGTCVPGFPNLFFLLGPNTGLGHTSVVLMAEAQVDYVMRALDHLRSAGGGTLEVRPGANRAWNHMVQKRMRGTVWTSGGCSSWYIDRNGLNTTLWPDFTFRFQRQMRSFDPSEYDLEQAS